MVTGVEVSVRVDVGPMTGVLLGAGVSVLLGTGVIVGVRCGDTTGRPAADSASLGELSGIQVAETTAGVAVTGPRVVIEHPAAIVTNRSSMMP